MMLRLSGDTVDSRALEEWCRRLELTALLEDGDHERPVDLDGRHGPAGAHPHPPVSGRRE